MPLESQPSLRQQDTRPEVRAAGAMMQAMGALERAASAFTDAEDDTRARVAQRLLLDVQALDPNLHKRVYAALPDEHEPAVRVEVIAEEVGLDHSLAYRVLELMRWPLSGARMSGGWWRRTSRGPA